MENMELYNRFRTCPKEAQKPITAGRLKGMTDINPMWRIKALTEAFGPCGFGWKTEIVDRWIDVAPDGVVAVSIQINLYVKYNGEWSEPIPGIGGSMFVAKERDGLHAEDECYKKAYTDAISVACKAIGIAADIYFAKDPDSKYPTGTQNDGGKNTAKQQTAGNGAPVTKAPQKQLLYPQILDEKLGAGIYADKTWREVYKTDRDYIQNFPLQTGVTDEMTRIVDFINREIKKIQAGGANHG